MIEPIDSQMAGGSLAGSKVSRAKLIDVAHQFEASLMRELMTPFKEKTTAMDGEDGDQDGDSDAITSFAADALAKSISAQGGFGIARTILHYFEASGRVAK